MNRLFCLIPAVLVFCAMNDANGQWGYTIGQKEVPKVVIQKNADDFRVYPQHPRLFFRDTDLRVLRERIKGEFKDEWHRMISDLESRVLPKPAATFGQGKYLKGWDTGRNMAFAAVLTQDEKYITWARQWAETLAAAGPVGTDNEYRGRLQSLAVAYDWLYAWLSAPEKELLEKAIVEHIERNWYFAAKPDFVGGHSRWGNSALAAGLLSIVTERPELREKLLVVRENLIHGYHAVQGWIANQGGYHMGWAYSAAYLTGDNHCMWSSATNECVYYPWQASLPLFWIYGRQGDGLYANTGDAYTISHDLNSEERELLMTSAGIFDNPYAAWTIKKNNNAFADILYGDKNVQPLAPDDAAKPLPLSRNFGNAGVIIARDRWDEETTLLQFRSVPFYSANHHHRDENAFTLHYKAPLALDAGLYDEGPDGGYGRSHWRQYFTRTIAHNAIVVFDPRQEMKVYGKPSSNDGGQTYRTEPKRLSDILPGGHAHLDGIIYYNNTKDYTYAVGDATKAYDPDHVKLAQREIVYLRNTTRPHPIVVVFDRVESTQPEFEKKFLLHTVNEPVIDGRMAITENKGGRLSCLTVLPEKANLQLVGGPGKEFWVDGTNYPISSATRVRKGFEPGAWRLEVSPKKQQTMDYFLHVLFVDDADAAAVNAKSVKLVKNAESATITVDGWRLVFFYHPGQHAKIQRLR